MTEITRAYLEDTKWEVTPEQSEKLQKIAFKLGYGWHSGHGKEFDVRYKDKPFLYLHSTTITYDGIHCRGEFSSHPHKLRDSSILDNYDMDGNYLLGSELTDRQIQAVNTISNTSVKTLPNKWHTAKIVGTPENTLDRADKVKVYWNGIDLSEAYVVDKPLMWTNPKQEFKRNVREQLNILIAKGFIEGSLVEEFDKLLKKV